MVGKCRLCSPNKYAVNSADTEKKTGFFVLLIISDIFGEYFGICRKYMELIYAYNRSKRSKSKKGIIEMQ